MASTPKAITPQFRGKSPLNCSIKSPKDLEIDLQLCNNLSHMFHSTMVGSVDIREKGVSVCN